MRTSAASAPSSDRAASAAVLDAYLAAGGNAVDTADVYAGGRSEELLGDLLRERGARDDVVLATKYGFHAGGGPLGGGNPGGGSLGGGPLGEGRSSYDSGSTNHSDYPPLSGGTGPGGGVGGSVPASSDPLDPGFRPTPASGHDTRGETVSSSSPASSPDSPATQFAPNTRNGRKVTSACPTSSRLRSP